MYQQTILSMLLFKCISLTEMEGVLQFCTIVKLQNSVF